MISEGGGLVNHQENGVIYRFDITECMFSSGNGTERKRFVNLIHAGGEKRPERVVDLFCGIGYFSLAALTRVPADRLQQVYACDWNANALEYFRESLRLNRVDPTRVYLFCCDSVRLPGSTARTRLLPVTRDHGDKRMVSQFSSSSSVHRCLTSVDTNCSFPSPSTCYLPEGAWPDNDPRRIYSDPAALPASLIGVADRVSLGLLPDSTAALPTALILLNKEEGGILHVHTVSDSTATCGWRAYPCNRIDVTFYQDVARMEVEKWLSEPPPKVGNEKEKECDSAGKQQQQSSEQGEKKAETEKSKRKQKAALRKLRARTYVGNPKEPELKVAQDVLQEFEKALQGDIVKSYFKPLYEQRRVWVFSIKHIERVKSFSPGKYHYVVDTDCRPETPP